MNEGIPHDKKIQYDGETLALKSQLQRKVIEVFCGDDTHSVEYNAKVSDWIEKYSKKFREIFERRFLEENDFKNKVEIDIDSVVVEIVEEIKG